MEPSQPSSDESTIDVASSVSIVLDAQPSCLEFANFNNLLVVGTYTLEKDADGQRHHESGVPTQQRTGSLLVFRVTIQTVTLLQTRVLPYALLDLHFSPCDQSIFAVATSVGSVCLFSIDCEHDGALQLVKSVQVCDPSILVLSLAFQTLGSQMTKAPPLIATSLSDGQLAVFLLGNSSNDTSMFPVHTQEAWTVVWSTPSYGEDEMAEEISQFLFSGGDDSMLAKQVLVTSTVQANVNKVELRSQDVKTHGAGVTAILHLENNHDEVIVTGSYDEYVRVLTPPKNGSGRAKVLAEKRLGGGVWRLSKPFQCSQAQQADASSFNVLASCMHAGARVLEISKSTGSWSIEVIAKFTEHESMSYASDVSVSEGNPLFVSSSFYDRKLCIWSLESVSRIEHAST